MNKVKLYLDYAGYCTAKESHAIKGGSNKTIKFHALFGLISHPLHGWILFDTGYTKRFYAATNRFPNSIYAAITKVQVKEEDEVKSKLKYHGIEASDIQHVIITHFHADHIGGLKDFENARFYCSKPAYEQLKTIKPFIAFTKGILTSLVPADFASRVTLIEDHCPPVNDEILGIKYDLFNDQSIFLTMLEGHAAGQLGAILSTHKNKYFLVADACWLRKSFEEMVLPPAFVKLFFSSWRDFKTSLEKVHRYYKANPSTVIVPTHCFETTSKLISDNHSLNEL
jgi:glyoxylase-like metal-dependent hydrolase (beta-lactamase superfamily II)